MLGAMKSTALVAKTTASLARAVRQRFGAAKDNVDASAKEPLLDVGAVTDKLVAAGTGVKDRCGAAKAGAVAQLAMVGSAVKLRVGAVKGKCDVVTAGSAVKRGVDTVKNKLDVALRSSNAIPPLDANVNSECVEQLLAMGFAHKDVWRVVREAGPEDVCTVSICATRLCQLSAGDRSSASMATKSFNRVWPRGRMARDLARALNELDMDEGEDLEIALQLSKLQAEGSMRSRRILDAFQDANVPHAFWDDVAPLAVQEPDASTSWRLKPSVGTWLMPLKVAPALEAASIAAEIDPSANIEGVAAIELPTVPSAVMPKAFESEGFVSSRHGAVRCGA